MLALAVAVFITVLCAVLPHRSAPLVADTARIGNAPQTAPSPRSTGSDEAGYFSSLVDEGQPHPVKPAIATNFLKAVAGSGNPKQLVDQTIDRLSPKTISTLLTNELHLTPSDLADVKDVKQYAKDLAAIAMQGIYTPKEPQSGVTSVTLANYSSLSSDQEINSTNTFGSGTRKIYASLDVATARPPAVLAKWYRNDSPSMFSMERYAVPTDGKYFRVWMLNPETWDTGNYTVEFYSTDLKLLGESSFSVQ